MGLRSRRAAWMLVLSLASLSLGCTGTERSSSARPTRPPVEAVPSATAAPAAPAPSAASAGAAPAPSVAAPDAGPAYDLAADSERRVKSARDELGARSVTAVVSDVFVVVGPPGWQGGAFDQSVGLMRNAMAGYMNGRFGKKPTEAISVYLFPNASSYEAFCVKKYAAPCIAHFGFYEPENRYMVMNIGLGLGTLTHEIVHPLVESDFPKAPTWLNEGIASVFEQPILPRPGEIHGGKNWRHPRLRRALGDSREREAARLDRLFGMTDEAFRADAEDLHYAMARYVCQWLDERGKLWPFYQRWRDHVADDPSGAASFREVVGMTPAEAHASWARWVQAL